MGLGGQSLYYETILDERAAPLVATLSYNRARDSRESYIFLAKQHARRSEHELCELTALPRAAALYLAAVTPPPLAILSSRVWLLARKER